MISGRPPRSDRPSQERTENMSNDEVLAPLKEGRGCAVGGCPYRDHLTRLRVPAVTDRPEWFADNPLPELQDLDAWLCPEDWARFARWFEREKSHGLPVNPVAFLSLPQTVEAYQSPYPSQL